MERSGRDIATSRFRLLVRLHLARLLCLGAGVPMGDEMGSHTGLEHNLCFYMLCISV